jgi:hypothetical protein
MALKWTVGRIASTIGDLSAWDRTVFALMSIGVRGKALAAIAAVLALLTAGAALAVAVAAGAAPLGALDDTTVPVTTGPAPDPAPVPAPKPQPTPKPTPKPPPKRVASTPSRSYTPPPRTYSAPTYQTPQPATTKRVKRHAVRKHKKARKPQPAPMTTSIRELTSPTPSAIAPVPLGAHSAGTQTSGDAVLTSILFISGVSLAALLFLLAAALPGTPARFTPVGRVVIDHQQDLVLVGVAAFVITIFVYVLTGHGL